MSSQRNQYLNRIYSNCLSIFQAIHCFRFAIKYDFRCMVYWESLGDAYTGRGSYNSGIRVFQKILELAPDNCYAMLQIAVIKTVILRSYLLIATQK